MASVKLLWNTFFVLSFVMLYTEDFCMRHYAGFLQIGSQILYCLWLLLK